MLQHLQSQSKSLWIQQVCVVSYDNEFDEFDPFTMDRPMSPYSQGHHSPTPGLPSPTPTAPPVSWPAAINDEQNEKMTLANKWTTFPALPGEEDRFCRSGGRRHPQPLSIHIFAKLK